MPDSEPEGLLSGLARLSAKLVIQRAVEEGCFAPRAARMGLLAGCACMSVSALLGEFSGLLEIGGGTAIVPLPVYAAHQQQRQAHTISLAAMIPVSIGAFV